MFKIVEMEDGSTKVYDSETGRIICSVPKKRDKPLAEIQVFTDDSQKNIKLKNRPPENKRPKGIGRPILRKVNNIDHLAGIRRAGRNTFNGNDLQSSIQCTVTPLQWDPSYNQGLIAEKCSFKAEDDLLLDQDISEDCISQSEFLQTLQLCPNSAMQNDGWKKLKQNLPTRLISHIDQDEKFDISGFKVCEEVELFSPLGKKWFNETQEGQKRVIDDSMAQHCVKKYESFCKINLNSSTAPYSMRCRETKKYVSTFKSLKARHYTHTYCFNRKQRRERLKVLKTGLTKRGRKLKSLCRKCTIHLKCLPEKEIKKWTTRKPIVIQVIDLESPSEEKKCLQNSRQVYSRHSFIKPCSVKLENICKKFISTPRGVFVKGTDIKVNLDNNSLPINSFHSYARRYNNQPSIVAQHRDHPYHRYKPQGQATVFQALPKTWVVPQKAFKNFPKTTQLSLVQNGTNAVKSSCGLSSITSPSLKVIPIVDLSSDEDEDVTIIASSLPTILSNGDVPMLPSPPLARASKDISESPSVAGCFIFRCHACKHQSTYAAKEKATEAVKNHMFSYHKVTNLNMDLKIATNRAKNIFYIDVFNGYS